MHYFNGEYVQKDQIKLSVDNVGFLRGYGVFEFFKVKEQSPIFMEDHLDRLMNSAKGLRLEVPLTKDKLKEVVRNLLQKNQMEYSSIKVILSGGDSEDGYTPGPTQVIILNNPFSDLSNEIYQKGASLMFYEYERDFPKVKSTYYATSVALQAEYKSKGHIDVLYHKKGMLSEASRSNLFLIKEGKIYTNKSNVLDGVTRMHVIKSIGNSFELIVSPMSVNLLQESDEAFITSTSKRVLPIVQYDDQKIGGGSVGSVTQQVMKGFDEYLKNYIA